MASTKPRRHASDDDQLVVISRFRSTADAQIAQGRLTEVDIESMIRSDNAGGMYPALSGAELLVRVEDAKKASETLGSSS